MIYNGVEFKGVKEKTFKNMDRANLLISLYITNYLVGEMGLKEFENEEIKYICNVGKMKINMFKKRNWNCKFELIDQIYKQYGFVQWSLIMVALIAKIWD